MKESVKSNIRRVFPSRLLNTYWKVKRKISMNILQKKAEKKYEKYLSRYYKKYTSYEMDFSNPKTMTQKAQWMKLYDQDPRKSKLSDKYSVRSFVKELIGEQYLIPLISIDGKERFFSVDEIDFDKLPQAFVLKCNHGCGYNIIVKNKEMVDETSIKKRLRRWLNENYGNWYIKTSRHASL